MAHTDCDSLLNCTFANIMGYAKERSKLEKLSEKTTGLQSYDVKSLTVITDIYEQYSHIIRILKNKAPDAFNDLYLNELQQIKECKRQMKLVEEEEIRQTSFTNYKETLLVALKKTIKATSENE